MDRKLTIFAVFIVFVMVMIILVTRSSTTGIEIEHYGIEDSLDICDSDNTFSYKIVDKEEELHSLLRTDKTKKWFEEGYKVAVIAFEYTDYKKVNVDIKVENDSDNTYIVWHNAKGEFKDGFKGANDKDKEACKYFCVKIKDSNSKIRIKRWHGTIDY